MHSTKHERKIRQTVDSGRHAMVISRYSDGQNLAKRSGDLYSNSGDREICLSKVGRSPVKSWTLFGTAITLVQKRVISVCWVLTYFDIRKEGKEDVRVVVAPHVDDSTEVGHGVPVPGAAVVAVPLLLQVRHVRAGNIHHPTPEQPRLRQRRRFN